MRVRSRRFTRFCQYWLAIVSLLLAFAFLSFAQCLAILYAPLGTVQLGPVSTPSIYNRSLLPSTFRSIEHQEAGIGYSSITYTSSEKPTGAFRIVAYGIPFPSMFSLSYGPNRLGNVHPDLREYGVVRYYEVSLPRKLASVLCSSNATIPVAINCQWMLVNLSIYWIFSILLMMILRFVHIRSRIRRGECPACGYRWASLPRCPECGEGRCHPTAGGSTFEPI